MFDLLFDAIDVLVDIFDGAGDALADTLDVATDHLDVAADHLPESLVDTIPAEGADLSNDVMFGSGSTISSNFWGQEYVTHPDGSWEKIN